MLAYDMNGAPLWFGHGAPLRLCNAVQLGFKQVKWIAGIEFISHYSEIGGGEGGYNEDHELFARRCFTSGEHRAGSKCRVDAALFACARGCWAAVHS